MKRMSALLVAVSFLLSLGACTGMHKQEPAKVKCPACGYEYTPPLGGS